MRCCHLRLVAVNVEENSFNLKGADRQGKSLSTFERATLPLRFFFPYPRVTFALGRYQKLRPAVSRRLRRLLEDLLVLPFHIKKVRQRPSTCDRNCNPQGMFPTTCDAVLATAPQQSHKGHAARCDTFVLVDE